MSERQNFFINIKYELKNFYIYSMERNFLKKKDMIGEYTQGDLR